MKIAFLGTEFSFNPHRIGGPEIYARRLATNLSIDPHITDYILFDSDNDAEEQFNSKIRIFYFQRFKRALTFIKENKYDIVNTFYIPPVHYFYYTLFRAMHKSRMKFILFCNFYVNNFFKRWLRNKIAYFFTMPFLRVL